MSSFFNTQALTPKVIICWLVSLALPALLYFLLSTYGDPATLTRPMILFLCVTLWAVCAWAMGTMNDTAVAIILPILYIMICGVKQRVVYAPWLGDVAIITIGGFILGKIMSATGLGKRIAMACVKYMGGSFIGAMCGIAIGAAIIAPLVPSIMGKAAIFTAIAVALCDALKFDARGREATAVLLGAAVCVSASKFSYLTGAGDLPMGMALVDKVIGTHTMWMEYAVYNWVPGMLYLIMSLAVVLLVLRIRVSKENIRTSIQETCGNMGPMSSDEKRALLLFVGTIVLLATDSLHGIAPGSVLLIIAAISFLPGMDLMNAKRLASVNFAPLFFVMGCMSIGAAGSALKATDWLATLVMPVLSGFDASITGVVSYWVGAALNLLLTPLAATSSFTTPLVQIGVQLGIEPRIMYFSFLYGLDNIIFPYEYAMYLYFYSSGYISFRLMLLVMSVRMVVTAFFLWAIAIPWWSWTLG